MSVGLEKFKRFQESQRATNEAQAWVAHIGARGRGGDVLSLSAAHSALKLTVAGQYTDGGKNYWESPAVLNAALLSVIISRRSDILSEALALLKARETEALIAAKDEIAAVNSIIEQAAA